MPPPPREQGIPRRPAYVGLVLAPDAAQRVRDLPEGGAHAGSLDSEAQEV